MNSVHAIRTATSGRFAVGLAAIGLALAACGVDPEAGDAIQSTEGAITDASNCGRRVFVHVSNFTDASPLNDPNGPVRPNGCWGFNMSRRDGSYWGECKGAMSRGAVFPATWVANWGSHANWEAGGARRWFYNETSFAHDPPDEDRIANCFTHFSDHWNTRPAEGYAYMMYRGSSGWRRSQSPHVAVDFAEVYGEGTWWPYWEQWKANPVGAPMIQIADSGDAATAYHVVRTVCEHIAPDSFMGIDVEPRSGGLAYDRPAWAAVVRALNACTAR